MVIVRYVQFCEGGGLSADGHALLSDLELHPLCHPGLGPATEVCRGGVSDRTIQKGVTSTFEIPG